jgi:hypothetical protein
MGCLDYAFQDVGGLEFPDSGIVVEREEEQSEMLSSWVEEELYAYDYQYTTGDGPLYVVIALVIAICGCGVLEELTMSIDFLLKNMWFPTILRNGIQRGLWSGLEKVGVMSEWKEDAELWGPDFVDVRSKLLLLFFSSRG